MGVVTDHHHVAVPDRQQVDDLSLQAIRVLIFVDQNVLKLFGVEVADRRFLDKQAFDVEQEVVVIHNVPLLLTGLVLRVDALYLGGKRFEIWVFIADHVFDRHVGIVGVRDDALNDLGFWETLLGRVDRGLVHADVDHLAGVLTVEDRIALVISDTRGMAAKYQVGDTVKRSSPDAVDVIRAGKRLDPAKHFAGRPIGECGQQYALRRNTLFDQICHSVSDRTSFARSGTGNHECRFGRSGHHAKLLVIELTFIAGQPFWQGRSIAFYNITGHRFIYSTLYHHVKAISAAVHYFTG